MPQLSVGQRIGILALLIAVILGGFIGVVVYFFREGTAERSQLKTVPQSVGTLLSCIAVVDHATSAFGELLSTWDVAAATMRWREAREKLQEHAPLLRQIAARGAPSRAAESGAPSKSRRDTLDLALADLDAAADGLFQAGREMVAARRAGNKEAEAGAEEDAKDASQNVNRKAMELKRIVREMTVEETERFSAMIEEGDRSASRKLTVLCVGVGILAVVTLAVFFRIAHSIVSPLGHARSVLAAVASGDLTLRLDVASGDEIGQMAAALNKVLGSMQEAMNRISHSGAGLAEASAKLMSISTQVSTNMDTVAAATAQMGASIQEISRNAGQAATVATSAVQTAEAASAMVSKLGHSSSEIGDILKVINTIAAHTNLLALNATIEAARAGEAGRGFAVVATEVKDLARKTGASTDDVRHKIESIRGDTGAVAEAIGRIGGVIKQIHDWQASIASGVEEQNATTNQISTSIAESARGSEESRKAAEHLASMSAELKSLVSKFKC